MSLTFSYDADGVTLRAAAERQSWLGRLLAPRTPLDLGDLPVAERALAFALADLRALADSEQGALTITADTVRFTHRIAARLSALAAAALGLPPLVDLALCTDVVGAPGAPYFALEYHWQKHGQTQLAQRTGAVLDTADGLRRLPEWMLDAVEVAEQFTPNQDLSAHWAALARFRRALEPGTAAEGDSAAARLSMTDFLRGLEVRTTDRFGLAPIPGEGEELDFDVVPFSGCSLEDAGVVEGAIEEADAELKGPELATFQRRVRERGALPAYRVAPRSYLVVDSGAAPVLSALTHMQRAPLSERTAFVRNPLPVITAAVETHLRETGQLQGMSPAEQAETIEAAARPALVETREYSARVIRIARYAPEQARVGARARTTWLPETFPDLVHAAVSEMELEALTTLCETVKTAMEEGTPSIEVGGCPVPATPATLQIFEDRRDALAHERASRETGEKKDDSSSPKPSGDRYVLETRENVESVQWSPEHGPRAPLVPVGAPPGIRTALHPHQTESLHWQIEAWCAGYPGILNADEQGLGKTLQTIAFLCWLKTHMANPQAEARGPVLVVAPTSLLETWQSEVERHLDASGLGHLIRLYGAGLGGQRRVGTSGVDIDVGEPHLDFDLLHEAIAEGNGQRFWLLTTYTTLANYQHSLARLPFSVVVFDEIQNLKNPASLRAVAARAMKSDFRIGLTGTPIENSADDLWAIMDQLAPGVLPDLLTFRKRYATPDDGNMAELHDALFVPRGAAPPLALRRLKEQTALALPTKTRRLHPRVMPAVQEIAYEDARRKLAEGVRGAALKMLHHIRSVSVHPSITDAGNTPPFIAASARLAATFDVLREVADRREKALVFIESIQMQYRFIEAVRQTFGLNRVDLINGSTPIKQRQAIVERFQRGLDESPRFGLLVLGPRAAGTGLTLTAATHVIHLSRWWNPAVEEQCNDRIHRIGQTQAVTVHIPLAIHRGYREHSFDCLLHSLMTRKRRLARSALWPMGDTGDDVAQLRQMVQEERQLADGDPLTGALQAMFARDDAVMPPIDPDGSLIYE